MAPAKTTRSKTAKKPAARKARKPAAPKLDITEPNPQYDQTWHATLEAYSVLKSAGAPIPDEIRKPVEEWIINEEARQRLDAQQKAEVDAVRKAEDEKGPKWIRNCYHAPLALRLERQDKKRRIELQPRGQRGDIFPLEPGDEHDHNLIMTLSGGLIEVIGQTEAEEIVVKQTTNIQRIHQPLAVLRNERGEAGLNDEGMKLSVETEYNKQGVVVGYIDQNEKGEINPKDAFGGIRRERPVEQIAQFVPTGGNPAIVSSGFEPTQDANTRASIADDIARRAKGENVGRPEQALGLSVQITPPVKT